MVEATKLPEKENFLFSLEPEDEGCGIGNFRPSILKRLANLRMFTVVFSIGSLIAATLTVYVNSQVTTLEKQFGFNSAQTGFIMAANDIGFLASTLFVSYLAPKVNIPRWISLSMVLYGISGIICSFPHFLFGIKPPSDNNDVVVRSSISSVHMCTNASIPECSADGLESEQISFGITGVNAKLSLWIIVIGMILQGFAKGPKYPFLIYYLDSNVEKSKTGYYLGILISASIFGPALAFVLGGYFSRLYVTLEDVDIGPRHPRWIGAWWLGYIVFGIVSIIVAIPIALFPQYLNGRSAPKAPEKPPASPEKRHLNVFLNSAKEFCSLLGKIITNPVYVLLQISSCIHMFAIAGTRAFLQKYVENQFTLPAWKTNLVLAGLSLLTASLGTFFGGWLTKKFKFTPLGNLKYVMIMSLVVAAIKCLSFVFGCEQPVIRNFPGTPEMNSTCIENCICDDEQYFPICSEDLHNYFSPCHAGCSIGQGNTYTNCSCIPSGKATAGLCPTDCPYLIPYAILSAVITLLGTTCIMPKFITIIRSVKDEEKSLATALSSFNSSLFGWLLGPVIYGKIIDSICLLWDKRCGVNGACGLYDLVDFRYKFHGFVIVANLISACITGFIIFISRNNEHMNTKPGSDETKKAVNSVMLETKDNGQLPEKTNELLKK